MKARNLVRGNLWATNGRELEFIDANYEIDPDPEFLSYCEPVIEHSALVWGLEPTTQFMETLLPYWPPESTPDGSPYPEDALDEWRYRLAIYHALMGEQSQAIGYANAIIENPATPTSQWIEPAQEFIATYQDQSDIYHVCRNQPFAIPNLAFKALSRRFHAKTIRILQNCWLQGV